MHFLPIYSKNAENKISFEVHVTTIATGWLSFGLKNRWVFWAVEFFRAWVFSKMLKKAWTLHCIYFCCSHCWRLSVISWLLTVRTKEVLTPTSKLSSVPDSTKGNSSHGSGLSWKIRTSWNSIMHPGATWWGQVGNFSRNISRTD